MNKQILLPLLDDFLLNLKTNNYSEETIYNYERDLGVFSAFLNDININFDEVNKNTLLNYKAYLISIDRKTANMAQSNHKLTSYSINRMLSALRSYFKYLIDMDYNAPVSPESVKLMKTERKHPHVAELNEIIKLIESPSELEKNKNVALRNRAILEILFSTGMRISEIVNLKRSQIDQTGRIFIMGKGKKERFVYLTSRAFDHLGKYLFTRNDNLPYLFIPYRGKNIADKNKKISTNYLQEKIKRYRELLGINIPISAHSLRHGFATYLAENGANPAAIQILLGHESLETTTRYVHASDRYAEKTHHRYHPLRK
ncbi:tyrosine-type recombinase/integrase [Patescibacteria group bacterium]